MKVSTRVRYAVRALLDVAVSGEQGPVSLRRISERQQISLLYLQQLVRPLIAGGLVRSTRGPGGGLTLARPAADITLSEIFRTIEGSFTPVDCVANPDACSRYKGCVTRDVWAEVETAVNRVLESTTLGDLARRQQERDKLSRGQGRDRERKTG
jgi:Rrf2 family protein